MKRYTKAIEAFLDLVYEMNNEGSGKVYAFHTEDVARGFVNQLSSITQRQLNVKQSTNQVEVRIR